MWLQTMILSKCTHTVAIYYNNNVYTSAHFAIDESYKYHACIFHLETDGSYKYHAWTDESYKYHACIFHLATDESYIQELHRAGWFRNLRQLTESFLIQSKILYEQTCECVHLYCVVSYVHWYSCIQKCLLVTNISLLHQHMFLHSMSVWYCPPMLHIIL